VIPYVTKDDFQARVLEAEQPVLIDFTASWCPPCRAVAPELEKIDAERDDLDIVKVDVDADPEIAQRYAILSMPTFVLLRAGQEVGRFVGAAPKAKLLAQIDPVLAAA